MPGILDKSMKSFLSAVQFVVMLSNNDRNLYICNKKVYSYERCEGWREELKSQSKCFVRTCSPNLVLNPTSSSKMYVNPRNFLQIIILTTGVKRCPPYQVITCLVPLERTLTLPNSYRAPWTSFVHSKTLFSQRKWYFLLCPNPDFHSQPTKGKCTGKVSKYNIIFLTFLLAYHQSFSSNMRRTISIKHLLIL